MVINCDPLFRMIYSYTRKQAIEDGNLIDVTEQANQVLAIFKNQAWRLSNEAAEFVK
ncbi:hypothetical protein [Maridesulfovibrio sp.]|uniref:hypothetical protein n=1 Tax=unclassified Maridesulfovibrio TaxID=2794999 RepID=UPI003AFF9804